MTADERWVRRLFGYCRQHRAVLGVALATAVAASIAGALSPLIVRSVVDGVIVAGAEPLIRWLVLLVAVGVLRAALGMFRRIYASKLSYGVEYELRTTLFAALQRLDGAQQDRLRTGQVVSRSISDVANVERALAESPQLVSNLTLVAASLTVMAVLSPLLTVAALVIVPALYLLARKAAAVLFPAARDYSHRTGEVAGVIESVLSGVRVVKGFGSEKREQERLEEAAGDVYASGMRRTRLEAIYYPVIDVMPALGQVGVLALGGWLTLRGDITLGTFVAFTAYFASMIGMIEGLVGQLEIWQTAKAAFVRVLEVVDTRPVIVERSGVHRVPSDPPTIELGRVSFEYEQDHPVLRDVSLRIELGEKVALVGGTGSGKSTVTHLLARFYDPREGAIRIGGVDTRDLSLGSLRARLGLVFEESYLFSDTIAANIAYGRRGREQENAGEIGADVIAAARAAEADEFIRGLPDGYHTVIGERGLTLSGGQRQRVALARALIGDPPVLVLDDATSAVDAGVEAEIHATLRRVMRGRTTLLIAHRRSTLLLADRIVVLHRGAIVDVGTHEELSVRCERYRQLLEGHDEDIEPANEDPEAVTPAAWEHPTPPASTGLFGADLPPDRAAKIAALPPATEALDLDLAAARRSEPEFSLRALLRPFGGALTQVLTWMVLGAAAALALPWLTRTGVDDGVIKGDTEVLAATALLGFGVVLGWWFIHRRDELAFGRLGERMLWWLRVKSSAHLHRLGLDFYEREPAGGVLTRMTSDVEAVTGFVQAELGRAVVAGLSFTGVFAVMFTIDAAVTLALLPIIPVFVGVLLIYRRYSDRAHDAAREQLNRVNAVFTENVAGIRVAQAYGREARNIADFAALAETYRAARIRAQTYLARFLSFVEVAGAIALVIVLGVGSARVSGGELTVGGIVAFTLYVTMLFAPLQQMSQVFDGYQRARVGLRRIAELLRTPPSTPAADDPLPIGMIEGELAFDDVRFAYAGEESNALDGIALRVEPGETLAVVGESGAGKSTLLKLAARFYDPTSGAVRVDGVELRKVDPTAYRRRLGVVPQEPHLFAGTVRDAIAYGRPEASDLEVELAARAVGAHDMIAGLRHGYHHPVGERGRGLSAGQRQLLALARAQVVNPDILLLDEATAALDLATEAAVTRAGQRLAHRRTTLVIAHRLTTARRADRIAVLDHGRLVEVGTHEQLLAAGGSYAELWRAFAPEAGA